MQRLYDEVGSLDQRAYSEFHLSEELLMEHAAEGMAAYIKKNFQLRSTLLIAAGGGNNGADGIALARLLHPLYKVTLWHVKTPKSQMAQLQKRRADSLDIFTCQEPEDAYDVLVDAVVGTGFSGEFDAGMQRVMQRLKSIKAFKIACDVPSGLQQSGVCADGTFKADVTLTMGALKKSLFLDGAKDYVGEIEVVDLGLPREFYELPSRWNMLDMGDMKLPTRSEKSSHKGSYGHLACISGEKSGAALISAQAALRFGAGLVSVVGYNTANTPYELMHSEQLPANTTAVAIGMGLGEVYGTEDLERFFAHELPMIVDADLFHMPLITKVLERKHLVITPHPKEFASLLRHAKLADITVQQLQERRFYYAELFANSYPDVTLLLKGANVIIAHGETFFVNPHGSVKLAKGGSGDVLSGLVGALLAQGYSGIDAALTASLSHAKLSQIYSGADFSLTPQELIWLIGKL